MAVGSGVPASLLLFSAIEVIQVLILRRVEDVMTRLRRAQGGVLALLVIVLAACGNGGSSGGKSDFKIDWFGDLTAAVAINGVPHLNGFKTVIDWTNKNGGVDGHKIVLTATDSASDVNKGKLAYQNAVANGSLVMNGGIESNVNVPLAPLTAQNKVTLISLAITDNFVSPPQPYLYSTNLSYQGMANLQLGFVKDYLIKNNLAPATPTLALYGFTSAAVTTINGMYKDGGDKLGWKIVAQQSFSTTATDVSGQASAVANAKPDVVIADLLDSTAALDVKTLREKGFKGPIVDFVGASSPNTFMAVNDPAYYSLRAYASTVDTDIPGIQAVIDRAKATGNTADMQSVYFSYGYINGLVTVAALKICGDGCTSDKFNTALEKVGKVDASGLNEDIQITPQRHRTVRKGIFFQYDTSKNKEVAVGGWLDGGAS
jgi:ABC-type branched-subunit amino acid transport system substrate-binding protein